VADSRLFQVYLMLLEIEVSEMQFVRMRKAIGFLIILWGLSQYFTTALPALDSAARESFQVIEVAASVSQDALKKQ